MQLQKVIFVPQALMEFTQQEIDALFKASEAHYDCKCQQASKPGGVLWGLRNGLEGGKTVVQLKWSDLDLLGKIAEQLSLTHRNDPAFVARLNYGPQSFSGILQKMNEDYKQVNERGNDVSEIKVAGA